MNPAERGSTDARAPVEPPLVAKALRPVEMIARTVVAVAILCVLIFTLGQVVDRYVLKGSFNAYDQMARIALIWMTFIGAAMALRERTNIVVDLIDAYLPAKAVAAKAIVLDLLSLALMATVFGYSNRLLEVGAYQGVMGTPFTYREVYFALTTGSVLYIMFLLARLVVGLFAGFSSLPERSPMIILSFGLFFLLLLVGMDIGIAMIAAAIVGMILHGGMDPVVSAMTLVTSIDSAALITVPLFVLASEVMSKGGMLARLVAWSSAMIGHFRGSLSQVSITTNLIMAGISGSAVADAAATGGMLIPAMKKAGYKPGYPSAVIAAGAMLGPIIPPSIPLVVYAVLANVSIARLFLAAIVPGLVLATGYMAICAWIARRRDYGAEPRASWGERLRVTRTSVWALLMPILIIVGVRSGLFTDSEAAGVICLYALIICLFVYRDIGVRHMPQVLYEAGRTSGVVLFLLAASGPFTWLMNETRVAEAITGSILGISTDPTIVLIIISIFLLVIGTVLEPLPAMIMFLPTLLPIQAQLGIDEIHFAIVVSLNLMLGMVTPPVGMLLFVVSAVGRERIDLIVRESVPFALWMLLLIVMIIFFPQISTWLPSVAF